MAGRAGRRGKDTEGLVLYLPERDPISSQEVQRMMTGNKTTFISRMEFHYDFILKTLQSGNTTWMGLMSQSYWHQQHLRSLEGVKREMNEVTEKLAGLGLTEEMIQDMALRDRLEYELKTNINAAKKKAQQSLEQWKNKHMSPIYPVQWVKYTERKKLVVDLESLEEQIYQMKQYRETLYPLLRVLQQTGFLEPFTDPLNTKLTLLGTLATELNEGNPLLMSYAYTKGLCDVLSGEEIICFLCAFLNEHTEVTAPISSLKIPKNVINQLYSLDSLLDIFFEAEKKHGVQSPSTFWHLNSYWIEPVWRWIQGDTISTICEDYDVYEGNFMRTILKVSNLLEEFTSLATYTQNVEMLAKLENVQKLLVKGAAIPESLYLTI
jgi:superfamily II RNA helicase